MARHPFDRVDQTLLTAIITIPLFVCIVPWVIQGVMMNRLAIDALFTDVFLIWAFRVHRARHN